jgi:hypothetical protein
MSPDTRVKVIDGLVKKWELTPDDTVELEELGADDSCLADLVCIASLLSSLFRDEDVEREWLWEQKSMFDGLSALTLILDGPKSLRRVRETVEHMSGL